MTATSPNLLAFGFGSPALLGWLALAAVPILIHWLFRRRYREIPWAAMQFLHEAARKQSRRTRLEQLLLLTTRVLILTLAVLAFARPRWADAGKLVAETPPTLRVIVLDTSLSMGRKAAQGESDSGTATTASTLFDLAKVAAREIVNKSRRGDRFLLARIAGTEPRVVVRQPTLMSSAMFDEIDRLSRTFERGDVATTLRQLPELLATKHSHEQCEIILISDFQSDNWVADSTSMLAEITRQSRGQACQIVLVDVGPALPNNASIVSITTDPPIVAAEQPMSVKATVRNTGTTALPSHRIELRVDEQLSDSKRLDLPIGQDTSVEFTLNAPASGEHSVAVKLEDDSLTADNERWYPLKVRSGLSVLLVNGRPAGRPRESATFFVEQALSPMITESAARLDWLRVTTLPESELANVELDRHDVVFLCDVGSLNEADIDRLKRFADSGGGAVLSLGPSTRLDNLNELAFGSSGLMSVRASEIVTSVNPDGTPSVFGFDPGDFEHPLLHEFRGNPGAGLETALIRQYAKVEVQADHRSGAETALRFSTGDPAIVTQPIGRGRCVLITTSLDETWGEWAIWAPGFVPLIHELTQYAAAGRSRPRESLVGETIVYNLPKNLSVDTLALTSPEGTLKAVTPRDVDGQLTIAIGETVRPGIYNLTAEAAAKMTERFAVNVDPRESDSRRLDPREFSSQSGQQDRLIVREANSPMPMQVDASESESQSLALALLTFVFGLLFIEQALAWRFTAGLYVAILTLILAAVWFALRF